MPLKNIGVTSILTLTVLVVQTGWNPGVFGQGTPDIHKAVVKEVLQTSKYTYLLVVENKDENWLALPKMIAKPGETYYYGNAAKMTDFESKELKRKFKTVYFLGGVSATPDLNPSSQPANPHAGVIMTMDSAGPDRYRTDLKVKKTVVDIKPAEQGITIAELFANKEKYSGKIIRVRGKVTKFNAAIMDKNWIHIQDGTEFSGKFDLTATTDLEATVGDTVTLEGMIALGKDFGYGYSYEILMENAKLVIK